MVGNNTNFCYLTIVEGRTVKWISLLAEINVLAELCSFGRLLGNLCFLPLSILDPVLRSVD